MLFSRDYSPRCPSPCIMFNIRVDPYAHHQMFPNILMSRSAY